MHVDGLNSSVDAASKTVVHFAVAFIEMAPILDESQPSKLGVVARVSLRLSLVDPSWRYLKALHLMIGP